MKIKTMEYDVLVIGGGGAGYIAAYEACKSGISVALVTKGHGSTHMAMGALAGVGSWHTEGDSKDTHFIDTIKGGCFLNEQKLVRKIVNEIDKKIIELEKLGAYWERTRDGKGYRLRIDGGHSYPRSVYFEDRPGQQILKAVGGELAKRNNVRVFENFIVTKLLSAKESIAGAIAIDMIYGDCTLFKVKSIVLATGGGGQVYEITSQPVRNTGDGYSLALRVGAEVMDMEFIQFYPIGIIYPEGIKGVTGVPLYYSHLLNVDGERFMKRYDPARLELSTRDVVSRAIYKEIREGRGTKRGGVYCDATYNKPGFLRSEMPLLYDTCLKLGFDLEKEMMEVAPTCHYFMGGIRVNERWETSLKGLFAAGEAATGIHGANRLSQNSLTDIIVSGAIAGKSAAEYSIKNESAGIPEDDVSKEYERIYGLLIPKKDGIRPYRIKKMIKDLMWDKVGVVRNGDKLKWALNEILSIEEKCLSRISVSSVSTRFNLEWIDAIEISFMLDVAEAILRSALFREESRGAHYREDYPERDNEQWLKHITVRMQYGKMEMETYPVDLSEIRPR